MKEVQAEIFINKNILTFLHMHSKIEMLFCLEGELEVIIGKHKKVIGENRFVFIMPYTIHSFQTVKHSKTLAISLSKDTLPLFHSYLNRQVDNPFVENFVHPDIDYITKKLCVSERSTLEYEQFIGYVYVLLGILFKKMEFSSSDKKVTTEFLPDVLSFIEKNFQNEITLNDIAYSVGLNPSYLSRTFSDKIGYPITKYINEVRIDHAKSMLLSTDTPVTDIAFASGFTSIRTFNRVFMEHTGITPKEYRHDKNKTGYYEPITTKQLKDVLTVSGIPAYKKITFYK